MYVQSKQLSILLSLAGGFLVGGFIGASCEDELSGRAVGVSCEGELRGRCLRE